jgi:hypothetical protein
MCDSAWPVMICSRGVYCFCLHGCESLSKVTYACIPVQSFLSLQETGKDNLNFNNLLNPGNARFVISQEKFEGFSFMNHG